MSGVAVALASLLFALPQSEPQLEAAPFAPSQLLELPFPAEARLCIVVVRAARGELEAGAAAIAELAKERDASLAPERLERERARLAALASARREFLERCVAGKRKLKVEQDGKAVAGAVAEVGADRFVLLDGRGKRQEVTLAVLGSDDLLKRMSDLKLETGSSATRAYAALLAGRKSWAKVLDGVSDADAVTLREDGPGYAAMLATGAAGCSLQVLAAAPLPATGPAADATIAAIQELLTRHGRETIVVARRDLLRRLAAHAFARRFDAKGIAAAGLEGAVHLLPQGAVRISYEFKKEAELEDFVSVPSKHPSWETLTIKRPAAQWKHWLADDALRVQGQGCLRHRVEFETPVSVTFDVMYSGMDETLSPYATLRTSLCDDGKGSMVSHLDLRSVDLYFETEWTHSSAADSTGEQVEVDAPYSVRLEHDGKTARLKVASRPPKELPAPAYQRGGVAIYWKADTAPALMHFTIEGRVAPDGLAAFRDAAVAREVAALFGE